MATEVPSLFASSFAVMRYDADVWFFEQPFEDSLFQNQVTFHLLVVLGIVSFLVLRVCGVDVGDPVPPI